MTYVGRGRGCLVVNARSGEVQTSSQAKCHKPSLLFTLSMDNFYHMVIMLIIFMVIIAMMVIMVNMVIMVMVVADLEFAGRVHSGVRGRDH